MFTNEQQREWIMSKGGAQDYYLPKTWFRSLVGFTETEFDLIISDDKSCQGNDQGYPVFAFMKYLYIRWREAMGKSSDRAQPYKKAAPTEEQIREEIEAKGLKKKLDQQKYLSAVLSNEMKAALLMPKQMGMKRTVRLLSTISGMIDKIIIPNAAEELATEDVEGDVRKIVEILVRHFRKATDELREKTNNLSWDDDGEANLLKSRLEKLSEEDPEFGEHFEELYDEK